VQARSVHRAAQVALLAAVYFAAAKVSLLVAIPPGYATAIWPPSGIALAALLLWGNRLWVGVWIGSFAANLTIEGAVLASAVIATGSTLQTVVVAALIRRELGVPRRFTQVREVLSFVGIAAAGAIIAPTVALLPLAILFPLPASELASNWWTWWQGDACGMLIFAPLVLSWSAPGIVWRPRKVFEAVVFALLLLAAGEVVFTAGFGAREVTTTSAVICAMALWYTLRADIGPFSNLPQNEALLLLLVFVSTVVVTGLMLSAVLAQLEASRDELEMRVHERTKLLAESKAELVRAKEEAERASESKSQFLANMSHELRTPLNSLLILARLLADNMQGNLNPKQVRFAQTIYESGTDLLNLINDILDLAKIESGAITALHIAPARFEDLRADLERTFRQMAQEKGLEFSIDIAPGLPLTIRTDATRLKQVLKNLLANAFKFTRQGTVRLRIAPQAVGSVRFSVTDTGIGISPDKQQLIFEAFQQADGTTSRQYGGTGLGLSISRELTRLLGGELQVASEPGKGSTFTLILPLSDERMAAPA